MWPLLTSMFVNKGACGGEVAANGEICQRAPDAPSLHSPGACNCSESHRAHSGPRIFMLGVFSMLSMGIPCDILFGLLSTEQQEIVHLTASALESQQCEGDRNSSRQQLSGEKARNYTPDHLKGGEKLWRGEGGWRGVLCGLGWGSEGGE